MESRPIYKTAEELGISKIEHEGLRALVYDLPSMRHQAVVELDKRGPRFTPVAFNMDHPCGTACCIGGWLDYRGQLLGSVYNPSSSSLAALFYPCNSQYDWTSILPEQAARAIVNFLVTGDPQWDAVMAGAA